MKEGTRVIFLLLGLVLAAAGVVIGLDFSDLPDETLGVITAIVASVGTLVLVLAIRNEIREREEGWILKQIAIELWGVLLGSTTALVLAWLLVNLLPGYTWTYRAFPILGASLGCFVAIVIIGEFNY